MFLKRTQSFIVWQRMREQVTDFVLWWIFLLTKFTTENLADRKYSLTEHGTVWLICILMDMILRHPGWWTEVLRYWMMKNILRRSHRSQQRLQKIFITELLWIILWWMNVKTGSMIREESGGCRQRQWSASWTDIRRIRRKRNTYRQQRMNGIILKLICWIQEMVLSGSGM